MFYHFLTQWRSRDLGNLTKVELEALQKKIFAENNFYTGDDAAVRWATLKENASILGAALLAIEKIFSWMDVSNDVNVGVPW